MSKDYPLHPGQTHVEPLYVNIPLEEYERIMQENKRLESQFGWRSWKLDPPKANGNDDFIFCGHQKYDHQPDEETEYFVDVGYLDMDGSLCMFNDWHEGQETFEIDYWFPLPSHPDEPKKETKEDE